MRLSTAIRHTEDSIVLVASRVARSAKRYAHDVKIEYRARQLAAMQQMLRRQLDRYQRMSPAQKAAHILDQMEIERRLATLLAERDADQPITND